MADYPYLLENWHSISDKSYSLNSNHHSFAFSSQIDFNGSGLRSQWISAKRNKIANFYALSPTLPYFVNRSRFKNNFAAKNCLLFCQSDGQNLFITSDEKNKIFGLLLDENEGFSSDGQRSVTLSKPHIYSRDVSTSCGPFRYCTQNLIDLYSPEEEEEDFRPIFELKVHKTDDNESQIQTNSRNKICFFKFSSDVSPDVSLNLLDEFDVEDVRRSEDSLFECCDRNELIDNQLLISYTKDNVIHLLDMETKQMIGSFDSNSFAMDSNQQIGVHWAQSHPKFFFYGEHKRIRYCDSRTRKPVIHLFNTNNEHLFKWEKFYQILPTKLNPNQLFVATDYHILVTDWRYPKKNLIQLNHMIPKTILRSLKSIETVVDNNRTELLLSSNFYRNCLMSFTSSSVNCVTPSSTHYPIHLSTPKDIERQFEEYFFRGIELIDSKDSKGFSLALLTNSGDVFLQDFFWDNFEDFDEHRSSAQLKDRTFTSGVGSMSLELDENSSQYMEVINEFLYRLSCERIVDKTNYFKDCLTCGLYKACKMVNDECVCKRLEVSDNHVVTDVDVESDSNRSQLISRLYEKHLGTEIIENKKILENPDLLMETTDKYTKNILQLWDDLDQNQAND